MNENPRFSLVFAKLRELTEEEPKEQSAKIRIHRFNEITAEELKELDELRRTILEVTNPEMTSFTTT